MLPFAQEIALSEQVCFITDPIAPNSWLRITDVAGCATDASAPALRGWRPEVSELLCLELLPFPIAQGHALFTRQAGSTIPCPKIDLIGGFNEYFAEAYQLPEGVTIKDKFGKDFGAQRR